LTGFDGGGRPLYRTARVGFKVSMTQEQGHTLPFWREPRPTALLVLANGMILEGAGFGATGAAVGEVCFNTAMTDYQEILTDPFLYGPDHYLHLSAYRQRRHQ
jgi:hypothetical protein